VKRDVVSLIAAIFSLVVLGGAWMVGRWLRARGIFLPPLRALLAWVVGGGLLLLIGLVRDIDLNPVATVLLLAGVLLLLRLTSDRIPPGPWWAIWYDLPIWEWPREE